MPAAAPLLIPLAGEDVTMGVVEVLDEVIDI
jgi:hypothetical protein